MVLLGLVARSDGVPSIEGVYLTFQGLTMVLHTKSSGVEVGLMEGLSQNVLAMRVKQGCPW